jgi:hypothetical protein
VRRSVAVDLCASNMHTYPRTINNQLSKDNNNNNNNRQDKTRRASIRRAAWAVAACSVATRRRLSSASLCCCCCRSASPPRTNTISTRSRGDDRGNDVCFRSETYVDIVRIIVVVVVVTDQHL